MTRVLELALHLLVVVELSVDDDVQALVLVGDRLIASMQVDDAEARMPETDTAMRRDPVSTPVRPAMVESPRRSFQRLRIDRITMGGEQRHDAAHSECSYYESGGSVQRPALVNERVPEDRAVNEGFRCAPLPALCPARLPARRPSVTTASSLGAISRPGICATSGCASAPR